MSELVRVTYPGVEGQPLVSEKRAALMVARGWQVVTDETPVEPATKKTSAAKPAAANKPDSRAESNINKEL